MSDLSDRMNGKADRDEDDVRAADPEEGITSYQNLHAQEESLAEGEPWDEPQAEDGAR
ncbi:hypothetical protein ACGFX4_12145 [Kitasatospora sp. NPDC048365]|uniref:hypothetical protein n=1 Tax=Kitasatospora sp. NPDC048365 TaxID=3364050 RepID=UPI00372038BA